MRNTASKVFQVASVINLVAVILTNDPPHDEEHTGLFDMYSEVFE
jgi:hypothetical protein